MTEDNNVVALAEQATKAWEEYSAANPQAFSPHGREMTGRWRTDRVREAMDALMFAAPAPFAELAAKARVARLTDDDDIGQQLMFDIGRLAGDIDPDAVPEGFEAV
jgi:hypothetical protein